MFLPLALALSLQHAVSPGDSAEIRRAAESSQARFERGRKEYLPWYDGGSPDPCDEIIGRYCYRYGDREELGEPPPDSAPVMQRRDQLIGELSGAARALPGDGWITGQLVRYLLEAKRVPEAETAARACRPPGDWWCIALQGFARHGGGHFVAAESAYAAALAAMPAEEQCRWRDLTLILDRSPEGYRRSPCEGTAPGTAEARFWWLADPLYLVPGNERRSEHFSRWVMDRLQVDARSPSGDVWSGDQRQILIRFGWPSNWSRSRRYSMSTDIDIVAHYATPQRAYEPPARYVDQPALITRGSWTLVPDRPPGGYVPRYTARMDTLPNQIAVFRRGGSAVIVAGYDLSRDSVRPDTPARAGLILSTDPGDFATTTVDDHARARGVLVLETPATDGLLSLEVLAADARRAGRQRYWMSVPAPAAGRPSVSDLLLLSRSDSLPRSLDRATPFARPSTVVAAGTVGLYWEVYGLGPGAMAYTVGLTVIRESIGFFRRAARVLGLSSGERPQVRLGWTETSRRGDEPAGSSLALDLSSARPGRYTIRLVISARGDSAVTERGITIKQGES